MRKRRERREWREIVGGGKRMKKREEENENEKRRDSVRNDTFWIVLSHTILLCQHTHSVSYFV